MQYQRLDRQKAIYSIYRDCLLIRLLFELPIIGVSLAEYVTTDYKYKGNGDSSLCAYPSKNKTSYGLRNCKNISGSDESDVKSQIGCK